MGALAAASGLNPGYVSRLLDALDRDALITRGRRGVVEDVDLTAMLLAWAAEYDVFKPERTSTYIATAGATATLKTLAPTPGRNAVTGSFAAVRLAPVAGPSLLTVYSDDPPRTARQLGLLPADDGANVALIDDVVWERSSTHDGVTYAAESQVAADCLTGNGRMPAEGQAVLQWMAANEDQWRLENLPARDLR